MIKYFTRFSIVFISIPPIIRTILLTGVFFYIFLDFDKRTFWGYEVFPASSLISVSFHDLATLPLDYQHIVTIGFLGMVRFFVIEFGNKELALQLFPVICGISSLGFFTDCKTFCPNQSGSDQGIKNFFVWENKAQVI